MAPGIDGDRAALSRHPRLRGVLKVVALWVFFVLSMSGPYLDAPWWLSWPILLLWFSTTAAAGLGVCAAVIAVPLLVVLAAVRRRSSHRVAAAAWAVAVIALLAGIHQYEQLKRRGLARAMERGDVVGVTPRRMQEPSRGDELLGIAGRTEEQLAKSVAHGQAGERVERACEPRIVRELCRAAAARAKAVADAQHAALAMEHGCELVSRDGDFARFEPHGLRWHHLILG